MSIEEATHCDICGIAKGETNHWLMAVTLPASDDGPEVDAIAFAPIGTPYDAPGLKEEHLCGHACAHKRLDAWLETLIYKKAQESEAQ